jgi:hypothetical protein
MAEREKEKIFGYFARRSRDPGSHDILVDGSSVVTLRDSAPYVCKDSKIHKMLISDPAVVELANDPEKSSLENIEE